MILLAIIVYAFGILFTQAALEVSIIQMGGGDDHAFKHSADRQLYFGTLPKSMITLFAVVTGGTAWTDLVDALAEVPAGGVYVAILMFYVAFTTFAVLNVITGVFCQSAVESAALDKETAIQCQIANKQEYIEDVRELFRTIDSDNSGQITRTEFEATLQSEEGLAYLSGLEMEVSDAWVLFKLLDIDGGGVIETEEFVQGCLRLRGAAKSVDVARILSEHRWIMRKIDEIQ